MNQDGQINSADDDQRKSTRMVKMTRRLHFNNYRVKISNRMGSIC